MSNLSWLLRETRRELGPCWPILVFLAACGLLAVFLGVVWAVEIAGMLMRG